MELGELMFAPTPRQQCLALLASPECRTLASLNRLSEDFVVFADFDHVFGHRFKLRGHPRAGQRPQLLHFVLIKGQIPIAALPTSLSSDWLGDSSRLGPMHPTLVLRPILQVVYDMLLPELFADWFAKRPRLVHRRGIAPCWSPPSRHASLFQPIVQRLV